MIFYYNMREESYIELVPGTKYYIYDEGEYQRSQHTRSGKGIGTFVGMEEENDMSRTMRLAMGYDSDDAMDLPPVEYIPTARFKEVTELPTATMPSGLPERRFSTRKYKFFLPRRDKIEKAIKERLWQREAQIEKINEYDKIDDLQKIVRDNSFLHPASRGIKSKRKKERNRRKKSRRKH